MAVDSEAPRRRAPHLSIHDQELLSAKNAQLTVRIALAVATYFTDDDGTLLCQIEKVDKYAIRVTVTGPASALSLWLMKQAILSTEVRRAT